MIAMSRDTDTLIAELVAGLSPVRPMRFSRGIGLSLASLAAALAAVILLIGLRADVLAGSPDPLFLLSNGLFLLLGIAASVAVVMMSRPKVGNDHSGWAWATAMAALLPVTAIIFALGGQTGSLTSDAALHGLDCLVLGSAFGLLTFAALVSWLRRGAPTSLERAGLVTGIASGSFGIFAYSLHCNFSDIVHIGIWHGGVVMLSAFAGRFAVPQMVRW